MINNDIEMKAMRKQLIDQVVAARIEKGLTQSQLAEMLGTQRSNISRFEKCNHNPSLGLLLRIATALNVELIFKPDQSEEPFYEDASGC